MFASIVAAEKTNGWAFLYVLKISISTKRQLSRVLK